MSDDDPILEWPLQHGQKYCDRDGMARPDGRYCWVVAFAAQASLQEVSGVPAGDRKEFVAEYKTNPDDKQFSFVPEIGLTKYAYHHHGTVADTELQLIECHSASSDRKQLP